MAAGDHIIRDWYSVPEYRGVGPNATPAPVRDTGTNDGANETLTVMGTICPPGYQGDSFITDCSAIPAAGAPSLVQHIGSGTQIPVGGEFLTAGATGIAAFNLGSLGPGTVSLLATIPPDVLIPGGFTVPEVRCFDRDGAEVDDVALVESRSTGQIIRIYIGHGEHPRCNVYFLPLAPSG